MNQLAGQKRQGSMADFPVLLVSSCVLDAVGQMTVLAISSDVQEAFQAKTKAVTH